MMNDQPDDTHKALRLVLMALENTWNGADISALSFLLASSAQVIDVQGRTHFGQNIMSVTPAGLFAFSTSDLYCTLVAEQVARLSPDLIYATARVYTRRELNNVVAEKAQRCVLILHRDQPSSAWQLWLLHMLSNLNDKPT
jgi:hypothetical protein